MSKLPDELSDLEKLERLDISHNSYISLPNVVFKIPHLKYLNAQNNHILGMFRFHYKKFIFLPLYHFQTPHPLACPPPLKK